MAKNVIFMMNVDLKGEGRFASSRIKPYELSVKSWKHWADKNDCELFVLREPLIDHNVMGICWQRWYVFDLLESNGIEYDQILSVDADTIVHPDCPNFFEMTDRKFTVVHFDGSWDWVLRSLESYSKFVFSGYQLEDWSKYFDSGFWIVNEQHKEFAKLMTDTYHENIQLFKQMEDTFHTGTEQTPLNFLVNMEGVEMTHLPYEFNMNDMPRKELLHDDMLFTKVGWVYQFNCIPNNKDNELTNFWMQKAYQHFYG